MTHQVKKIVREVKNQNNHGVVREIHQMEVTEPMRKTGIRNQYKSESIRAVNQTVAQKIRSCIFALTLSEIICYIFGVAIAALWIYNKHHDWFLAVITAPLAGVIFAIIGKTFVDKVLKKK